MDMENINVWEKTTSQSEELNSEKNNDYWAGWRR